MKVTKEVFETMKSDIKVVLDYYNVSGIITEFPESVLFAIWHKVYQNRYSPSTVKINGIVEENPNVDFKENGERLLERNTDFVFYPCNTNDATLLTALRKAVEQVLN